MLQQLFADDELRKHLNAPLLTERQSYLESKRHRDIYSLRLFANILLGAVDLLGITEGRHKRISINDIIHTADAWVDKNPTSCRSDANLNRLKRRYVVTVVNWLRSIERLDLRLCSNNIITRIFLKQVNRVKYIAAPLIVQRATYIEHLEALGYTNSRLVTIAEHQLHAIRILHLETCHKITTEQLLAASRRWSAMRMGGIHAKTNGKSRAREFRQCVEPWLKYLGWLQQEEATYPNKEIVTRFIEWAKSQRGYSDLTCRVFACVLRLFMVYLSDKGIKLQDLKPAQIDSYVLWRAGQFHWRRITIIREFSNIKVFLAYCSEIGLCSKPLINSLTSPKMYPDDDIPSYIPWELLKGMLEKPNGMDRKVDIRNYAIFLIFTVYGIRAGELARIKLEDINWERETITITRTKNRRIQTFPLNKIVGDSIIEYLRKARPRGTSHRNVFLSMTSPIRPMTPNGLYSVVANRIKATKVSVRHKGPHSLRHSCATHLVNSGFSFKEVADILGHRQMNSTFTYAKVDFASLKTVSEMQWEVLK